MHETHRMKLWGCARLYVMYLVCISVQYAKWSALQFAIKNGDQRTVDFLMANKAETDIKDQASAHKQNRS